MLEQRYRLGRILGEGGMASVYLGEDTKLGKAIAVKVLHHEYALQPKVVQRFTQEARAISKVRHPNVVDVTDHGETPDRSVYLVMELLHGEDLSATLDREGPMPWTRLGPIVLQICAALATVHAGGIVHRDIKPSNCFRVRVAGNPDFIKVLDFGIAKVLDGPAAPGAPQSTTGSLLGTPEYMAPELPKGLRADARVDIYALGVLMYKLLTGTAPFTGEVYMAILAKHMFDPVEPLRVRLPGLDVSDEVEAVVLRALAKEREDRFPSMVAMAEAVAATLPGSPSAALWLEASRDAPAPAISGHTVVVREPSPYDDLEHADTSPRMAPGPETIAQPVRRRSPTRAWLLAATAGVIIAVVVTFRALEQPTEPATPERPRAPAVSGRSGAGPAGQLMPARTPPLVTTEKPPGKAAPPPGKAAPPIVVSPPAPPVVTGAKPTSTPDLAEGTDVGSGIKSEPRAPLDLAAGEAVVRAASAKVRRCAAEHSMIGGFALAVKIDRRGAVTGVDATPDSRKIPMTALVCMRAVLADESFPTSARGGVVEVDFAAK